MVEMAGGILVAVLLLVYLGEIHVAAAALFGGLLVPFAAGLVLFLRLPPVDVAVGIVGAALVIASICREANEDKRQETRRT